MSLNIPEHLPFIRSISELAALVHASPKLLYRISNHSEDFYRITTIPKRNGDERTIEAPVMILKNIQKDLLRNLLNHLESHPAATAFEKGRSIKDNAARHVQKQVVLNLDLKNFFPSIHISRVYAFFRYLGYEKRIAILLSHLCCLNTHLPQGAPTSPKLSNLLLYSIDERLEEWALLHGLAYTRYADDMTFSGRLSRNLIQETIHYCCQEIRKQGLHLNKEKVHVQHQGMRQTVTGLVVNQKVSISREKRRAIRLRMHYIQKFGWDDTRDWFEGNLKQMLGTINFAIDITNDPCLMEYRELLKRERIYPEDEDEFIASDWGF